MRSEGISSNPELLPNNHHIEVPATESLLDERAQASWPAEVVNNEQFQEQVRERRQIIVSLEQIRELVPDPTTSLETAISDHLITEDQAEGLYNGLSDLLENPDYERALFYVPFEFLPNQTWHPSSEYLRQAIDRFRSVYLYTWEQLLYEQDVRANFVDGDVIEAEQRPAELPRVAKAAHLAPFLVRAGLISEERLEEIKQTTTDPILHASLAEAIPLISEIKNRGVAETLEAPAPSVGPLTFTEIRKVLDEEEASFATPERGVETERRQAWLRETRHQQVVEQLAQRLNSDIVRGATDPTTVFELITSNDRQAYQEIAVAGIRLAIEDRAKTDLVAAQSLYADYGDILSRLETSTDLAVRQQLVRTYRHLHHLGVIETSVLEERGITEPNLAGPVAATIDHASPELQQQSTEVIAKLNQAGLGDAIYPVVLMYGSRIKGYGEESSDFDEAIFVRPGTAASARAAIDALLPETIQFWLDEDEGSLLVHDFADNNVHLGARNYTHTLFGGVWTGDSSAIQELKAHLLTPYFADAGGEVEQQERGRWLFEMEKDALLYRLLHKGYDRYAAPRGGIKGLTNAENIDGQSAFYDSGYRRVAIELFARRVFLPRLAP